MTYPLEVHVFENQRRMPMKGFVNRPRLPADIDEWTDLYLAGPVVKENLEAPRKGKWTSEWTIEKSGTDDEGWEYAHAYHMHSYHPSCKMTDFVRRRRWIRKYEDNEGNTTTDTEPGDGKAVPDCQSCFKKFTVVRLRHHCRSCHNVVCNQCCGRMSMPGYGNEQRVCNLCLTSNGLPPTEASWRPGKHIKKKVMEARSSKIASLIGSREISKGLQDFSDAKPCGHFHVRLYEARDVPAAWAGEVGTPNPYITMYLAGSYLRSPSKTQTHSPKWGEQEATYVIPCSDPTASLFLCIYDSNPQGLFADEPIGRASIQIADYTNKEADLWVEFLPAGTQEAAGYDKEKPRYFRGCSKVSEMLGMQDPKRGLGFLRLKVQWVPVDKPVMGLVQKSYYECKVSGVEPEINHGMHSVKDTASRMSDQLGLPSLLLAIWSNQILSVGSIPIWAVITWRTPIYFVPFLIAGGMVANGIAAGRFHDDQQIILFESENPYAKPNLWAKLHKIPNALNAVKNLENPLGKVATFLSKLSSLFSYKDFYVSVIATIGLFSGACVASFLLFILSRLPIRLYIFLTGSLVLLFPLISQAIQKKKPHGEATSESGSPLLIDSESDTESDPKKEDKKQPTVQRYVKNFFDRVPDDRQLLHGRICRMQIRDGPLKKE
eukprot:TRINITY_DN480_c0_g4_i1.p1 TRINITY_DN480_c0_g4~~TRINITY_DN480_c0_g4_i1.p1  ORF type:complete len:660 (+),score=103.76 TRINITY_DN480_c0_g4_i1:48-2027(+)